MSLLKLQHFLLACVLYQVYLTTAKDVTTKRVVCYYTNGAQNREGKGKFNSSTDIPANLCTHIIFAYSQLIGIHLITNEDDIKQYKNILKLKECNKNLKVLLAVTGWPVQFKIMTSLRKNIERFAHNARDFLVKNGFDGLDFFWEYPDKTDKMKFTELLRITREVFRQSKKHLLITAEVPIRGLEINASYEVKKIAKVLDFLNIRSYDIHSAWDKKLGHNAPLYSSKKPGSDPRLNVAYTAELWTSLGVPKEKMVIGIPTYARTLKIADSSKTNPEDPSIPNTNYTGPYTNVAGVLAYYEVCELLPNATKQVWEEDMQVPYAIINNHFTGYDDERAVENKADFITKKGYGGAMVWSIDLDDFSGESCGKGKYPLITAIDAKIRGGHNKDYLATCAGGTLAPDSL